MKLGIITYYWPPAGGPGVQRWLKLSKYLAREGVDVFVVTVNEDEATYPLRDEGLAADVHSNITVVRTRTNEKFGAYQKVTGKKQVPFSGFSGEDAKVSLIQKVARFVRGNFFVPDARKGWNKYAYKAAAQIIAEHEVQHWITTSPPHSTQLLGMKLKKNFGIHWTADFRDPWTDIYYYRKFYPTVLTRAYERYLEKRVFVECDVLISVSQALSNLYVEKGASPASKVYTLSNGFDAEDFQHTGASRPEVFTVTYAGTMTSQYAIEGFIAALNRLDFPVRFRIIGKWDEVSRQRIERAGDHVSLEFVDYVPKKELNRMMIDNHMSFLILPEASYADGITPGKMFDYFGVNNPILCIGPTQGDAARILRSVKAGDVFHSEDVLGMEAFIRSSQLNDAGLDTKLVYQYERNVQAKEVIRLIFGK